MNNLQKNTYRIQPIMIVLVPVWVAIGRSIFGAGGWLFLLTVGILGPLLFVGLLAAYLLFKGKYVKAFSSLNALLLLATYVGSFIFGFLIEDGGDTKESVGSAASKLFNTGSSTFLNEIAYLALAVALASLAVLIARGVYARTKK